MDIFFLVASNPLKTADYIDNNRFGDYDKKFKQTTIHSNFLNIFYYIIFYLYYYYIFIILYN